MQQAIAMILAGGNGKRMGFLCQDRAKPALHFAGTFRIIDFSLSNCMYSQIRDVAVLTSHQRINMAKYLNSWHLNNPGFRGFHILEPEAGFYKGTADAVYKNLDYLMRVNADEVLILAGDHIYSMDYRLMLAFHRQVKADVTIGIIQILPENVPRFGVVTIDPMGKVVDFTEKPRHPQSNMVSMGIYVFNKRVLYKRLIEDAARLDSPHDFGYAILPKMVQQDRVFAYEFRGYWRDIGTVTAFYRANMEILNKEVHSNFNKGWPVLTVEPDSSSSEDFNTGNVVNSIVSPDCVVKGRVENSVLSPGVIIDNEAVVRNSILMSNVYIGYHSVVDHCILDEQVNVGNFCYLGFGEKPISDERDTTILGKGAIVPHYTAIGHNCKVLPNVEPDDFTMSLVPSGNIVSKHYSSESNLALARIGV
ncbi:glucose-1-phosphate adenylyltransferase family protein [Chloroflexota bacterium]